MCFRTTVQPNPTMSPEHLFQESTSLSTRSTVLGCRYSCCKGPKGWFRSNSGYVPRYTSDRFSPRSLLKGNLRLRAMRRRYQLIQGQFLVFHRRSYETIRIFDNLQGRRPPPTPSTKSDVKAHVLRYLISESTCFEK